MPAFLMALVLLATPTAPTLVPLALGERQVVTLEFTRPVAKLGVTDADALLLEPSGTRVKVTALRAGRSQVEVTFDDGVTLAWDVTVVAPRKVGSAAVAGAGELELAVGEERKIAAPGLARVLFEESGVVKVRPEREAVVLTATGAGRASVVLVDGAGKRTTLTVRVKP
jgi:Pilus formation protein N terminal region